VIVINRKWNVIIILVVVVSVISIMYVYYQSHPKVMIETEISQVDDKTYRSIGGLSHVKYPEKENFKQLKSLIKVSYSKNIEDVEIELSKPYSELLGKDIYWTGKNWQYPHPDENFIEHYDEIIIYMGGTTEDQLKEMLSKGTITVTWKENEKVMKEKHTLDESVLIK
jgi:hypothetical protein